MLDEKYAKVKLTVSAISKNVVSGLKGVFVVIGNTFRNPVDDLKNNSHQTESLV